MKLRSLVLGAVCAVMFSVPAWGQNAPEPQAPGGRQRAGRARQGEGPRGGAMMIDRQMEQLNKELNLTKEQQDKIRKLLTDHQTQMREAMRKTWTENREKLMELRKQMQEAQKAGDKEKVKTLEGQMRDLMGQGKMEEARKKLATDIAAVLTDEQKPKFEKIKGQVLFGQVPLEENPRALLRAVESLKLPKEKMDKIRGIFDEWRTKTRATRPKNEKEAKEAKDAAAEVYKKVMAELTPEQQAKVKEFRPGPMGWRERGEGAGGRGEGGGRGRRGGARGGAGSGAGGGTGGAAAQPK